MYFFFGRRERILNAYMTQATPGIQIFKTAFNNNLFFKPVKQQKVDPLAEKAVKIERDLNSNLKLFRESKKEFDEMRKDKSRLFYSLFCPWKEEFKLRIQTGKYMRKAENEFEKLTHLAGQWIRKR